MHIIDTKGNKINKGVKTILQERGYYPKNPLNLKCKVRCLNLIAYLVLALDKLPCYLAKILLTYKDFFEQKSAIRMLIKGKGYKCVFIPKFHCKLNPIEIY